MNLIEYIKNKVFSGNKRSAKAKKNIIEMLFLKGGNILIGILLVPMTLNYVDSETYGIWLALSSMVAWISFFDIGINNGLKNKLAEAFAKEDYLLGKKYVSTTYAILTLIFIPLMIVLLVVVPFIDWSVLLNLDTKQNDGLLIAIAIIIAYFCINFILSTINVVLMSDQRPADASLRQFVQQLTSLIIIYVLTTTTKGSLINLCLGLCASPLIVILLFNFTLFTGRYRAIAPSFGNIDFSLAPNLLKLGIQFFVIQIAAIIQYQMINFLILRYYGAAEVAAYNIAFKYFSILTMVWSILISPLWVAVTDAISRNDYAWINNVKKKYIQYYFCFVVIGGGLLLCSSFIYDIWIGDKVSISLVLSIFVLIYNLAMMFGSIFVMIINGSGQLKLQSYASIVSPFVFIFTFFMCNNIFCYGVISVLIAAIISNFNGLVLAPIQCRKILKSKI